MMKKGSFVVGLIVIIFILVLVLINSRSFLSEKNTPDIQTTQTPSQVPSITTSPTDEQAELVGFEFMQNFIAQGPPAPDLDARQKAYDALSSNAKASVSQDQLARGLALFVGVQDMPNQGISVEDLQVGGDQANLIVGMNYSGSSRILKSINMVVENGVWKIDSITTLDEYPPVN